MDKFRAMQQSMCAVGGLFCSCCNSYTGKDKPVLNRRVRRRLKSELRKIKIVVDSESSKD